MTNGHAIRYNGIGYWLHLSWNTGVYYTRQRRWIALTRALWLTIVLGYYGEVCEVCGRRVWLIWHADDALYQRATGITYGGGLFCPRCFDQAARASSPDLLVWVPLPRGLTETYDGFWRDDLLESLAAEACGRTEPMSSDGALHA